MSSNLFNYYFNSTDIVNGSNTLIDQSDNNDDASCFNGDGNSSSLRSSNVSTEGPYDNLNGGLNGGIGQNTATESFIPNGGRERFFAKSLDSSDEINTIFSGASENTSSFTICVWLKANTSGNGKRHTIFCSGEPGDNDVETFQIALSNNTNSSGKYSLILNLRANNNEYFDISNTVSVEDNKWRFVAITYDYNSNLSSKELKTYLYRPSYTGTNPEYYNVYTSSTGSSNGYNRILSTYLFGMTTYKFGTNRQNEKFFTGNISGARGYNYVLTQSQINNIYLYNSLDGTSNGDPHIKTIYGISYKFDYVGYFRIFDNNEENLDNRLVINGYSEEGDGKRWEDNQYIKKVFIYCGKKSILIKTGFRGEKAQVIESNNIEYFEEDLSFDDEAKVYCSDCRKKCDYKKYNDYSIKNHIKKTKHNVPKPVRNRIIVNLNINNKKFILSITNVNKFNLQPCRINLEPLNSIDKKYTGTIINRKFAVNCKINNLTSLEYIPKMNYYFGSLPLIEEHPSKINKQFY